MIHESLLTVIGNTPLVRINFDSAARIYAKLEYLNPGGSIKDRSALYMIEEAEQQGLLRPGGTLIEASSGNQGIATAMIGAIKGYKVIITVSEKASIEKVQAIEAYGAKVIRCPVTKFMEDPQSYHSQALNLQKSIPNSFIINQYRNKSNVSAHYNWLGKEIWNQTQGKITHFFAGAGTCGTISGVGKYLKEQNPKIKIIAIDSINSYRSTKGNPKPYKLEGLGVDFDSPILDNSVIDEFIEVSDEHSLGFLKILARKHGFLVGLTSGAVAYAAQQYARKMNPNNLGVIIFGDSGRAYLSKGFYSQLSDKNFIKINDQKNLKNLEI